MSGRLWNIGILLTDRTIMPYWSLIFPLSSLFYRMWRHFSLDDLDTQKVPGVAECSPPPLLGEHEGSVRDARGAAESISSYLSALPTIRVHSELDERTIDIVHCLHNIAGDFPRWKVAFSALIKLQILHVHAQRACTCTCCFHWQHFSLHVHVHVHVLFSPVALSLFWSFDVSDVSATISDTFSKSPRNPNPNVG